MTNTQTKSIQESIFSIREVALSLLTNDSIYLEQMASIINDRCTDIEVELYVQPSESEFKSVLAKVYYFENRPNEVKVDDKYYNYDECKVVKLLSNLSWTANCEVYEAEVILPS